MDAIKKLTGVVVNLRAALLQAGENLDMWAGYVPVKHAGEIQHDLYQISAAVADCDRAIQEINGSETSDDVLFSAIVKEFGLDEYEERKRLAAVFSRSFRKVAQEAQG